MSALDLIGRTPIVKSRYLWKGPGRILRRRNFCNLAASVKDRVARAIVDTARAAVVEWLVTAFFRRDFRGTRTSPSSLSLLSQMDVALQ